MADNQIRIVSISIENYRSILKETIIVDAMNIFVGLNDVGKSNVLKALNLFFNGASDYNARFDFDTDFTLLYDPKSKNAREISIEIVFDVPDNFKESGKYFWKKVWKKEGLITNEILNSAKKEPSERMRVKGALRRIKYRYVPAVKSENYYNDLLGELYKSVAISENSSLHKAMFDFSTELKSYTRELSDNVLRKIGLHSILSVPNNFSDIFRTLMFNTHSDSINIPIPLTSRGDGIQARHIPIILKFIAQQELESTTKGSTKINTIWGFEEPENGLEMLRSFQMANDFHEYSNDIQMFITTHSPAFYMKKEESCIKVFYVKKDNDTAITYISNTFEVDELSEEIGLMPIVAPYIAKQNKQLEELLIKIDEHQKTLENTPFVDIPTIFVEGKSDLEYISMSIKCFSEKLQAMINDDKLRIKTNIKDGAGTSLLTDWTLAWIYTRFKSRLVVLFDKDKEGRNARKEITDNFIYQEGKKNIIVKLLDLVPNSNIIELYKKNIDLHFEIEHLLNIDFWETIIEKGLATERSGNDINEMINFNYPPGKALRDVLTETIHDKILLETLVLYEPHIDKKMLICKAVKALCENNNAKEILIGFEPTIRAIEKLF